MQYCLSLPQQLREHNAAPQSSVPLLFPYFLFIIHHPKEFRFVYFPIVNSLLHLCWRVCVTLVKMLLFINSCIFILYFLSLWGKPAAFLLPWQLSDCIKYSDINPEVLWIAGTQNRCLVKDLCRLVSWLSVPAWQGFSTAAVHQTLGGVSSPSSQWLKMCFKAWKWLSERQKYTRHVSSSAVCGTSCPRTVLMF